MKKLNILLLSALSLILFSQCNNPTPDKLLQNSETRGKVISALMNDDNYSKELMDSMMHTMMAGRGMSVMMSDASTKNMMMNNMMSMCSSDTSMCKMMMDKTMGMCDMDKSKCKMMMGSMQEHPKGIESMKDMGMCGMKSMNMAQKKGDHSQHH